MKGPSEAAKRIDAYVSIDMEPRPAIKVLIEIIEHQNWADEIDSDELAAKWVERFLHQLRRRAATESAQGKISLFEFNSVSERHIQGSCFVEPRNSSEEAEAKRRRANCIHLSEALSEVSYDEFEVLCARALTLWNVDKGVHTRRSGDQGIDFFGRMAFGETLTPTPIRPGAEKQMHIWLVGQAKCYSSSRVSTSEVREFVGSVNLARMKIFSGASNPLEELHMRAYDPVFLLFFTTGSISKNASCLLRRAGVVSMDGQQLAIFMADRGVGIVDGSFELEAFRNWAFGTAN